MRYQRPLLKELFTRVDEPRKFIQVIAGPRQVGKTTMAMQLHEQLKCMKAYHSADDTLNQNSLWIDNLWNSLRAQMDFSKTTEAVLLIDEIQKIKDWSQSVKRNWDRDTREKRNIKLILLGSSRLLLMDGLSESLTGRYELSYAGHWGFPEMKDAFGFSPNEYIWFGGYPGAAELIHNELRFKAYIKDAIIEPTMMRDILMTAKIEKPALLRQLFEIGAIYSTQIMSYNRLLGQMQDAGNTTTLARYAKLLEQAGLLSCINKYSNREIKSRGTIPKFLLHNTALLSALKSLSFENAISDAALWGNIFEGSVGAHLVHIVSKSPSATLYYWRENNAEIDFVVKYDNKLIGIEVKSGDESISEHNAEKFRTNFPKAKLLLVGKHGIPYDMFMQMELPDL